MKDKYIGFMWKDIPKDIQKKLLSNALCIGTEANNLGFIVDDGPCIVNFDNLLAIPGEVHNGEIIINEIDKLYNPTLDGENLDNIDASEEKNIYEDYEKYMKNRPHVVLLGAGASVAALPNGDKNGKKISAMAGFIKKLGMEDIISDIKLNTKSDNLEDIYMEMYERKDCNEARKKLEERIKEYFLSFEIPDYPTIYDYLVLSLTKKDLIATFNWDPLLVQAYCRCLKITENLPQLAFLHGNVAVGFCDDCSVMGNPYQLCSYCKKPLLPVKLLYPIKNKDYTSIKAVEKSWKTIQNALEVAYMVTIFGYSAPKSDIAAIDMLKKAWGDVADRKYEEIEIIDIREEDDVIKSWEDFIHTHHYSVHNSFFDSTLSHCPRRSCEATFDRLMNCRFIQAGRGYKENMNFEDIKSLLKKLVEEEKMNSEMLSDPYI